MAQVKGVIPEAKVKARMNSPTNMCHALDPKPCELSMARMNLS